MKDHLLTSKDSFTELIRASEIDTWLDLVSHIQNLPYGRNSNREDLLLVFKEKKGTCSSKHAFLKHVANLNNIPEVKLILGMYKMNERNTPKIGNVLTKAGLNHLPEAHCYLKSEGKRYDFTHTNSSIENIAEDILEEQEIRPDQVAAFKIEYHKVYLKQWLKSCNSKFNFQDIWKIREKCIANLSS